ncbi:MAG: AAA family ATPase, partial [Rectinema sp.]|nr:AAA family ATPase [Rectinema sp.]
LMLWGPPGIGKSHGIKGICKRIGADFYDIRPGETSDPADIVGVVLPSQGKNGEMVLERIIPDHSYPPSNSEGISIINFDEISAASRNLQIACYRVLLDRMLGNWKAPKYCYIMAAGNTQNDSTVAYQMSSALANRLCHLEVEASADSLLSYAASVAGSAGSGTASEKQKADHPISKEDLQKQFIKKAFQDLKIEGGDNKSPQLSPLVSAYLMSFPADLYATEEERGAGRGWASPRTWEQAAFITHLYTHAPGVFSKHEFFLLTQGLIGVAKAHKFTSFVNDALELPNIYQLLTNKELAKSYQIPTNRPDLIYALGTSISQEIPLLYKKLENNNNKEFSAIADNYYTIIGKMPADFAAASLKYLLLSFGKDPSGEKAKAHMIQQPGLARIGQKLGSALLSIAKT